MTQSNNNSGGGSVSQSNNNSTPGGVDLALGAVTAVGTLASGIGAVIGGIAAFKSLNPAARDLLVPSLFRQSVKRHTN